MLAPWKRVLALASLAGVLAACEKKLSPQATADEYHVYSAYLRHYAATRKKQQDILVMNRTFPPRVMFGKYIRAGDCAKSSNGLLEPLLAAGDKQYALVNTGSTALDVPFEYRMVSGDWLTTQKAATRGYYGLMFTRVSFDRTGNEAFFGVATDVCYSMEGGSKYPVECGDGSTYFLRAHKTGRTEWTFEDAKHCPMTIQ